MQQVNILSLFVAFMAAIAIAAPVAPKFPCPDRNKAEAAKVNAAQVDAAVEPLVARHGGGLLGLLEGADAAKAGDAAGAGNAAGAGKAADAGKTADAGKAAGGAGNAAGAGDAAGAGAGGKGLALAGSILQDIEAAIAKFKA